MSQAEGIALLERAQNYLRSRYAGYEMRPWVAKPEQYPVAHAHWILQQCVWELQDAASHLRASRPQKKAASGHFLHPEAPTPVLAV